MLLVLSSCYKDNEQALYPVRPGTTSCDTTNPTYTATIQPIMLNNCTGCHYGVGGSADLDLTTYDKVMAAVNNKHLLEHVSQNGYSLMPPSGATTDCNISQLRVWIRKGMPN